MCRRTEEKKLVLLRETCLGISSESKDKSICFGTVCVYPARLLCSCWIHVPYRRADSSLRKCLSLAWHTPILYTCGIFQFQTLQRGWPLLLHQVMGISMPVRVCSSPTDHILQCGPAVSSYGKHSLKRSVAQVCESKTFHAIR